MVDARTLVIGFVVVLLIAVGVRVLYDVCERPLRAIAGIFSWWSGGDTQDQSAKEQLKALMADISALTHQNTQIAMAKVFSDVSEHYSKNWLWIEKHGNCALWSGWNDFVRNVSAVAKQYNEMYATSFETVVDDKYLHEHMIHSIDLLLEMAARAVARVRVVFILTSIEERLNITIALFAKFIIEHNLATSNVIKLRFLADENVGETSERRRNIKDPGAWVQMLAYIFDKYKRSVDEYERDKVQLELIEQHFAISSINLKQIADKMEGYRRDLIRLRIGVENCRRNLQLDTRNYLETGILDVDYLKVTKKTIVSSLKEIDAFIDSYRPAIEGPPPSESAIRELPSSHL